MTKPNLTADQRFLLAHIRDCRGAAYLDSGRWRRVAVGLVALGALERKLSQYLQGRKVACFGFIGTPSPLRYIHIKISRSKVEHTRRKLLYQYTNHADQR